MLQSLRRANRKRDKLYPGSESIDTAFRAIELGGECGELLNLVKKLERHRRGVAGNLDSLAKIRAGIADEMGDVLICLDLLAMDLGIDLENATIRKFNASSRKLGIDVLLQEGDF